MTKARSRCLRGQARTNKISQSPIGSMPVEIILEIMELMGPEDLVNFGLSNKFLHHVFTEKRTQLLLNVVRACPELDILLRLYMVDQKDFLPDRMLHAITVTFSLNPQEAPENKIFLLRSPVHWQYGRIVCPEKIRLEVPDLVEIAKLIHVVDWWVDMYPRLRWRDNPEDRRRLGFEEEVRLRRALARWWLYSEYFHGAFWRNAYVPRRFDDDDRLHHIRILTTQEILELDDLLTTMYETVSKDLCSSPGEVYSGIESDVELVPWGKNGGRHPAIVNTYLKLGPHLLKYFLGCSHRFNKEHLIKAIADSTRDLDLLSDQETLSMSIATVLEERSVLDADRPKTFPAMGIIDQDRASVEECGMWDHDAWPSGFPPITMEQLAAQPNEIARRLPRGDDGADRTW
ncbi:hypothetical protein GGS20DRAFT_363528 [Poronia punctata]|nr:hypothetical protein GGS20DRAFT_363528 [Poronia punctata]